MPAGRDNLWKRSVIAIPYFWLFLFFLVPFAIIFKISLADPIVTNPARYRSRQRAIDFF